jgi:hypothetical protein
VSDGGLLKNLPCEQRPYPPQAAIRPEDRFRQIGGAPCGRLRQCFADPEILGGGNVKDAVRATIPLLDFFRHRKLPVFFTRIVYADNGSDCGVWCEKAPRLRDLIERAPASR